MENFIFFCSDNNEFELVLSNFGQLLSDVNEPKLSLSIITGNFNGRSSSCWSNETEIWDRNCSHVLNQMDFIN